MSHWKAVGVWRNRVDLDSRVKQRGSEGLALLDCPAPRLGVRDVENV